MLKQPPDRLAFKPEMVRAILSGKKTQTRRTNYERWANVQRDHRVLVGETWGYKLDGGVAYATDETPGTAVLRWHAGFTMPKRLARYTIRMTAPLRVERLHAITEADALAEGVGSVAEYEALWGDINGFGYGAPGSWSSNPWVGVLTFELVTP